MEKELDKTALLNQLKIDHNETSGERISVTKLVLACFLSGALSAVFVYFYFPRTTAQTFNEELTKNASTTEAKQSKAKLQTTKADLPASLPSSLPNANEVLNASGYITPRRITTVSAEVMGLITDVLIEEGLEVKQGQVLAEIDKSTASISLQLAQAQLAAGKLRLESLSADIEEAKRVLRRVSELKGGDFSSEAQRTRAETDLTKFKVAYAGAKADIQVQKLHVALAQEHYDNHTIRAPFNGVVTVKTAQPGILVAPNGFSGTGICTIVDMDSLEIEVDVNESFIRRVFPGQRVVATLDAYPKWDVPAKVIATIPTADRAKATVSVRIKIETEDNRILPDMGVKVAFLKGD